jgi:hypothetical protein
MGATQYVCTGWAGTGSVPLSGATTNVSFTITNTSSIAWQWTTNYWLEVVASNGWGGTSVTGAWYASDSVALVEAFPADGYRFDCWSVDGMLPPQAWLTNGIRQLRLPMNSAHAVRAEFVRLDLPEALDNWVLPWTTGGGASWIPQTVVSADGTDAAASGIIGDSAETWLQAVVGSSGTLSFDWRVSCQDRYDSLQFMVDGVPQTRLSGESGWQSHAVFLEPGSHVVRWAYVKGKSGIGGADRAWLDRVTWMPGVPGASWTLNVVSSDGAGAPVPTVGSHVYTNGQSVTASATSPQVVAEGTERRVCTGWTRTGVFPLAGDGKETTFDMTTDDTLTWLWKTEYWLGVQAGSGGTVDSQGGWIGAGTNVTVTAMPDAHHHFVAWVGVTEGCTVLGPQIGVPIDRSREISAQFAIDTYEVIFDLGGHGTCTGGGGLNQTVAHGGAALAPQVRAAPGWTFLGWDVGFGNVTGSLKVRARFEQVFHTLTVESTHGMPDPESGIHPYAWGDAVACMVSGVETFGATQYVCTGWAGTGSVPPSGVTTNLSFTITNDSSVAWSWATNFWLDVRTAGNGGVDATSGWHAAGSSLTLTVKPDVNHHFAGWSGDVGSILSGDAGDETVSLAMTGPVMVTANFAINTYPVVFDLGAHGTQAGGGGLMQTVAYGEAATAPSVLAAPGWTFTGWSEAFDHLTSALTIRAQYDRIMRSLTVQSPHGMPQPAAGSYQYPWGDPVACLVLGTEVLGTTQYVCQGWIGTGSAPAAGVTTNVAFTLTNDSSVAWSWATNYWLEVQAGGGSADFNAGWMPAGTSVTVTVRTPPLAAFLGWTGDTAGASYSSNSITVDMMYSRLLKAGVLSMPEALDCTNLTWASTGTALWSPQTVCTADGMDAGVAGRIDDLGWSRLETTVRGPGRLTFVWRASCETGYDWFDFLMDGSLMEMLTGETGWHTVTLDVPRGRHTLQWEYWKDESLFDGDDGGWLDQVIWQPEPITQIGTVLEIR